MCAEGSTTLSPRSAEIGIVRQSPMPSFSTNGAKSLTISSKRAWS
jgi:hypothetical protein